MSERWLIATIGMRDPDTESGPTGPLRVAAEIRPSHIVLLYTAETAQQAEASQQRIKRAVESCHVTLEALRTGDPTAVPELLGEFQRRLSELPIPDDAEVHICGSSGTPQLWLALTLAADVRFVRAQHWQALDPARASVPLLREFTPDALRHHAELVSGFHALTECRARDARDVFTRRVNASEAIIGRWRPVVDAARRVADALALAEDFQLAAAALVLKKDNLRANLLRRAPALEELASWYGGLAPKTGSRRANKHWPVELASVAQREYRAGRGLLAIIRLALAHEVALQVRLLEAHQLDCDQLSQGERDRVLELLADAQNRGNAPRLVPIHADGDSSHWRLEGVQDRFALICALEADARNPLTAELSKAQINLIETRNDLVHRGSIGSGSGDSHKVFERGLSYLSWLFSIFSWPDPTSTPSAPAAITRLARELASAIGISLE